MEIKEIKKGAHDYTSAEDWVKPAEKEVLDKLEWFRDQKLALMMHFGIYSQLGIIESWPIVDFEKSWSRKDIDWTDDGEELRKQYFALNKSFNPVRLQADKWAEFAKENGFKYLIFTTKHHDGFCLWDTKQTDYKATDKSCPYSEMPKPDIVKNVFDAFRSKGLGITAYFSKPDWHSEYFWEKGYTNTECQPSYDVREKPEMWEKFVEFTHAQIMELIEEYGPVDTLWLDGGWVDKRLGLDIRLGDVVKKAREITPGLIVVDRTCGGEYENYITPEMTIPPEPIDVPWEACLSVSDAFSYRYDCEYKSDKELIYTLIEIVAKGGNLALNIAPQPDGRLPEKAMAEVAKMGVWLQKCGEAIYGTRICAPYKTGNIAFTQKENSVYAIIMQENPQGKILIPYSGDMKGVTLLNNGSKLEYSLKDSGIEVDFADVRCDDCAYALKLEKHCNR